jgi:hypothetical protein
MLQLIQQHPYTAGAVALWIFSAIVSGMPEPEATDGKGYRWLYSTLHSIAGNLKTAFGGKIAGLKNGN